jgi:lipopolysaccharide/colanic/teichoic acid biosynthesis glycosyltransferase
MGACGQSSVGAPIAQAEAARSHGAAARGAVSSIVAPAPLIGATLAVVALAVASPAMALVALVVRADLGAPVLFSQRRAGRGGEPFTIWKFRTMRDARNAAGEQLPDAARMTRIGGLLRRLRIDELPQLLAIVSGRMAWIGPRPLLPATIAAMGARGEARCRLRPGLTGWAQVSGNTRLSDDEKLALDLWYVQRKSAALDARILLDTALVVLLGERRRERRIAEAMSALGPKPRGDGVSTSRCGPWTV